MVEENDDEAVRLEVMQQLTEADDEVEVVIHEVVVPVEVVVVSEYLLLGIHVLRTLIYPDDVSIYVIDTAYIVLHLTEL